MKLAVLVLLLLTACSPRSPRSSLPLDAPLDTTTREWIVGLALDHVFHVTPPPSPKDRGPFRWSCMAAQRDILAAGFERGLDPYAAGLDRVDAAVEDCLAARAGWRDAAAALDSFSTVCRRAGVIRDLSELVRCLELDASPSLFVVQRLAGAGLTWRGAAAAARAAVLDTAAALAEQLLGEARAKRPPVPAAIRILLRTPEEFWLRVEPDIPSYRALRSAHMQYLGMIRSRGWGRLPNAASKLKKGRRGPLVELLGARLDAEGYLPEGWTPARLDGDALFDADLANALGRFQVDHGLRERRRMDRDTLRKLNEPAIRKLARIRRGLRRMATAVGPSPGDLILVQAPAAVAEVYFDGRLWQTLRVVLGSLKKEWNIETRRREFQRRTPELASAIDRVVLNPEWLVPDDIKEKEYDPKLVDDPAWYETHGFRLKTYGGGRELLIQEPGPGNALGRVKFLFQNPYGVYLHDTPAKRLFKKTRRLFSHGCVRVEDALKLAAHVLARDRGWTWSRVRRALAKEEPTAVKLLHPIHVRIIYLTVDAFPGRRPRWIPDWYEREGEELEAEVERLRALPTTNRRW